LDDCIIKSVDAHWSEMTTTDQSATLKKWCIWKD